MDFHSCVSLVLNNPELSDVDKLKQIKSILAGPTAVPLYGIVERLARSLYAEAKFSFVNPYLTSERCPTYAEPSLEGARLENGMSGSRVGVIMALGQRFRRPATVAEGLYFGLTHPDELSGESWIWCLDQIVEVRGFPHLLMLRIGKDGRVAFLCPFPDGSVVAAVDRVLSFPL